MPKVLSLLTLSLILTACNQTPAPTEPTLSIPATEIIEPAVVIDDPIIAVQDALEEVPAEVIEVEVIPAPPAVDFEVIQPAVVPAAEEELDTGTEPDPISENSGTPSGEDVEVETITSTDTEVEILGKEETEAYLLEQAAAQEMAAAVAAQIEEATDTPIELKAGQFVGVDSSHDSSGSVRVIQMGEDIIIEFENDFAASDGPDLFIYLSQPQTFGPKSRNGADISKMTLVSALSAQTGSQMYKISQADWDAYGDNIVIWCRAYGYLFGHAALN